MVEARAHRSAGVGVPSMFMPLPGNFCMVVELCFFQKETCFYRNTSPNPPHRGQHTGLIYKVTCFKFQTTSYKHATKPCKQGMITFFFYNSTQYEPIIFRPGPWFLLDTKQARSKVGRPHPHLVVSTPRCAQLTCSAACMLLAFLRMTGMQSLP